MIAAAQLSAVEIALGFVVWLFACAFASWCMEGVLFDRRDRD
jgi:hypothetical protein